MILAAILSAIAVLPSDRMALADRLFNRGEYESARTEYTALAGAEGIEKGELEYRLGECCRALGKKDIARRHYLAAALERSSRHSDRARLNAALCGGKDEMLKVNNLCLKHSVTVISDEIHCEMVMPGHEFTPFATISQEAQENCITCGSPSKSFNIAGLQAAFIVSNNLDIKARINKALIDNQVCSINPFGLEAFMAAYNYGENWILQFNEYIDGNFRIMRDLMNKELPEFHFTPIEGTYLAWIDVTPTGMTSTEVTKKILDDAKVLVNDGIIYGKSGNGFIRVNLATQRSMVEEATRRIINAFK